MKKKKRDLHIYTHTHTRVTHATRVTVPPSVRASVAAWRSGLPGVVVVVVVVVYVVCAMYIILRPRTILPIVAAYYTLR